MADGKVGKKSAGASFTTENAEVKVPKSIYKRRSCHVCCGISTAVFLILIIIILTLSFTIFKAKDPRITVTGMSLNRFSANVDPTLKILSLDVSLHVNVSVKNMNVASFKYENSSTYLFYRGLEVGRAAIPAGKVSGRRTSKFSTDLEIQQLKVVFDDNLTADLQSGIIPVSTHATIRGRLNVINIFKHHAVSTTECAASIVIANTTLRDLVCLYSLKI